MKKRQIKLETLKVKSFITSIKGDFSMTIRGGSGDPIDGNDTAYTCGTMGNTDQSTNTCPPGSGDGGICTGTTITTNESNNPNGPCLPGQTEP